MKRILFLLLLLIPVALISQTQDDFSVQPGLIERGISTGQVATWDPVKLRWIPGSDIDPVFSASVAAGITATQTVEWSTAYGWGDHSGLYDNTGTATATITAHNVEFNHGNIANGQTAYGWGNHASAGYITSSGTSAACSGNAATASTLQTARSIYGNSFNGSADLAHVIASTYGGTGNGYTKFTGPTTSEKTFTLPNTSTTIKTNADIVPLFGGGVDSTLMLTTLKFPLGYSNGIVIDTIVFISTTIGAGTTNVTPKLFYGTDIEASGTAIVTSPSAVTSHTTATKVSSFNNATIAKGNMIWLTFTDVTTKPRNFMVQIIGHKQ